MLEPDEAVAEGEGIVDDALLALADVGFAPDFNRNLSCFNQGPALFQTGTCPVISLHLMSSFSSPRGLSPDTLRAYVFKLACFRP